MIAESEQLRVEREKLLQERAAEEQLKRTRAATVLELTGRAITTAAGMVLSLRP